MATIQPDATFPYASAAEAAAAAKGIYETRRRIKFTALLGDTADTTASISTAGYDYAMVQVVGQTGAPISDYLGSSDGTNFDTIPAVTGRVAFPITTAYGYCLNLPSFLVVRNPTAATSATIIVELIRIGRIS